MLPMSCLARSPGIPWTGVRRASVVVLVAMAVLSDTHPVRAQPVPGARVGPSQNSFVPSDPMTLRDVKVAKRFSDEIRKRMERGTPAQKAAAATLTADVLSGVIPASLDAPEIRDVVIFGLNDNVQPVTPAIARLTHDSTPAVRADAARALARIYAIVRRIKAPPPRAGGGKPPPKTEAGTIALIFDSLNTMFQKGTRSDRLAVAEALGIMIQIYSDRQPGYATTVRLEPTTVEEIMTKLVPLAFLAVREGDAEVQRLSLESLHLFTRALERFFSPPKAVAEGLLPADRELPRHLALRPTMQRFQNHVRELSRLLKGAPERRLEALRLLEDLALVQTYIRERLPNLDPRPKDVAKESRWFEKLFDDLEPDLVANVTNPNPQIRLAVVLVLEGMGKEATDLVRVLLGRLTDPNVFVRWAAARSLHRIQTSPVPGELAALGRRLSDTDLDVRMAVSRTLQSFGPKAADAIPYLLARVNRGDDESRIPMIEALGDIGKEGKRVVPALARALSSPSRFVRIAAAQAIGRFGPDAALASAALERALNDPEPEVRRLVSDALLNIPIER
jgi:HEAT repeats